MLTLTLRALERDGLVTRTVFPTIPPRVVYELTELGRSLLDPVSELGSWARKNCRAIEPARHRFDATDEMFVSFTQKGDCHVRSSILGGAHSCSGSRWLC